MDKKYCRGCRNNFYNGNNEFGIKECWSFKDAKTVWRIPIGHWERPPYKNKRKVRVANCYYDDRGSNRTHYVDPENIDSQGYWK